MLHAWRFLSLMLTALSMSFAFAHLWQLPPRMTYEGAFWFETLSMYREFGPGGPGPPIELAALVAVAVLAVWVRRTAAFGPSLLAALCLCASFAAWWLWVFPVNVAMLGWTAASLPPDWTRYREQWEYAHAARALLIALALAALVVSLLLEIPAPARRLRSRTSARLRRKRWATSSKWPI